MISELRRRLAAGEGSSLELVRGCLKRISELDDGLRAFLRVNPGAERDAEQADRRERAGSVGPLNGIPVAVKDNLATAGLETTCASRSLEGFVPPRDATVVRRLKEAGAVLVGKTNLDEFSMGSSTESSAFGPTRNPWDSERVPGGSSGGSAAAVAAGLVPVALGSDTGGSIRQPAAFCGIVGIKPTYGRVSRSGLVAFASSLDQVGVLARTVSDAARGLSAIAGPDEADATSVDRPVDDFAAACAGDVAGLRVGLPVEQLAEGLDPEIEQAVRAAAAALEAAGARVREVSLPHARFAVPAYYVVATAEASSNLSRYDGVRFGLRSSAGSDLTSMYARSRAAGFGAEVKRRIMLGTYALSAGYHERFYGRAGAARGRIRRDHDELFESGIDLLLGPTTPTTAFRLGEKLDDPLQMYLSDVYTVTANLAGLPAIALPAGLSREGLPLSVQLTAPPFRETTLFRAGSALEKSSPPPRPPMAEEGADG